MVNHFNSKTVAGFSVLLVTIVGLAILGKLTPEAVEAIKWLGGSFMMVRTAANITENLPRRNEAVDRTNREADQG